MRVPRAESAATTDRAEAPRFPQDQLDAFATLAIPADSTQYRAQSGEAFVVHGTVLADEGIKGDSLVTPTHDQQACKPFQDEFLPRRNEGVGNAVVWIAGIDAGRANDLPKRTSVRLNDCRLDPRVHIVSQGGTVLVGSRDAMVSRLRLVDVTGSLSRPRALISLNDFGQVVPTRDIAGKAGLVEVRDDKHPWVRGFIVVSAHPYVAVTDASGEFRIEGVPPGRHELVVFSEALGVVRQWLDVREDARVELRFRGPQ